MFFQSLICNLRTGEWDIDSDFKTISAAHFSNYTFLLTENSQNQWIFLGLLHPYSFVRGTDTDPGPSIIKQK
jgi:hypothetical protein